MPRYKLTIEYSGYGFIGWQKQAGKASVQQAIEDAFERFCGVIVEVTGAGRTDAGVHAAGQTAHVDLAKEWDAYTVMQAVNHHLLPLPIALTACELASPEFHARFQATRRHYLYRIVNRRARPALKAGRAWHVPVPLDAQAMQEAARFLVGHHDFTSFRDSRCQAKSPLKTLDRLDVEREDDEIRIRTHARSYLHHQVRIMAGSLQMVGLGRWRPADIARVLLARDRVQAGPTAPPEGLYLIKVEY